MCFDRGNNNNTNMTLADNDSFVVVKTTETCDWLILICYDTYKTVSVQFLLFELVDGNEYNVYA